MGTKVIRRKTSSNPQVSALIFVVFCIFNFQLYFQEIHDIIRYKYCSTHIINCISGHIDNFVHNDERLLENRHCAA